MGCDIHDFISKHEPDNTWKVIETYGKSKYPEHVYDWEKYEETDEVMCDQFYDGRDYTLFGLLANVRGDGDDDFTEVRGFDKSWPELLQKYHGPANKSDFHGATWYNLMELKAETYALKARKESAEREIDYKLKYDSEYTVEDAHRDREWSCEVEEFEAMDSFYHSALSFLYLAGETDVASHLEDYRVYMWFDS